MKPSGILLIEGKPPRRLFTIRGMEFAAYRWNRWHVVRNWRAAVGRTPWTAWWNLRKFEQREWERRRG